MKWMTTIELKHSTKHNELLFDELEYLDCEWIVNVIVAQVDGIVWF